ncbi:hypothetical protein [Streptomyces sp. CC0208]|uniref:hypothetical protein n=1 Tax=Streptomyces sp. CC0208 TaxID=2306165 RepID=UPI0013C4B91F|nr:hypothetical protein [Streptomyces sp. CC0208]
MADPPTIALVDPFGAVDKVGQAFREAGLDCLRVQSTPRVPPSSGPAGLTGYRDNFVHDGPSSTWSSGWRSSTRRPSRRSGRPGCRPPGRSASTHRRTWKRGPAPWAAGSS